MALVKTSLKLFGGDTVVVRCSERCRIHLMSAKAQKQSQADILTVQDDKAWLTVPYTGTWDVLIDSHSQGWNIRSVTWQRNLNARRAGRILRQNPVAACC